MGANFHNSVTARLSSSTWPRTSRNTAIPTTEPTTPHASFQGRPRTDSRQVANPSLLHTNATTIGDQMIRRFAGNVNRPHRPSPPPGIGQCRL